MMSPTSDIRVVISAAILLITSLFIDLSHGVTQDVLSTICGQTQNQEKCVKILQSDQRTISADLPQLSLISLELTMKQIDKNHAAFSQLRDKTADQTLKNGFGKCVTIYQNMKDLVQADYRLSQQKQYKGITDLGKLTTLAYNCENGLPSNSQTGAITEDMLLTTQTAVYTNSYIAGR